MTTPRWARIEEFNPSAMSLGQTPDGRPAFWAAIVTKGPKGTNLPEEIVVLSEPSNAPEGLATAKVLDSSRHIYRAVLTDLTWSWRREGESVVLLKHGLEHTRLLESAS